LSKKEFLNFNEISSKISFEEVLNWLNIPFQKKKGELKGESFIVSIDKNLFFSPTNESVKGSIINFVSHHNQIELREAASLLKRQFLSEKKQEPKRDIPNLTLEWDEYFASRGITPEIARQYEVGYVKQRSIMSGRIALKIYDHSGNPRGYIGYKQHDDSWFFPKGFKRPLYNAFRLKDSTAVVVTTDPFDALKFVSQGFSEVVSLLGYSVTSEQEEELKRFKHILLLHPEPANIVNRLCSTNFVRAPVLSKPLKDLKEKEFLEIIK
jgi:DNA primase